MAHAVYMETNNAAIGSNVSVARARYGMSQHELARLMRARGHDWTQTTVWSTEAGRRSLKLVEAVDLANCLRANLWEIYRSEQTAVQIALAEAEAAASVVEEAIYAYQSARRDLMALSVDGEPEEVRGAYEDESARTFACGPYSDDE